MQCSIWYWLQQLLSINIFLFYYTSFYFLFFHVVSTLCLMRLMIYYQFSSSCHDECKSSSWGVCSVHSFCLFKDNLKFIIYFAFRGCVRFIAVSERERVRYNTNFFFLIIDYEWKGWRIFEFDFFRLVYNCFFFFLYWFFFFLLLYFSFAPK